MDKILTDSFRVRDSKVHGVVVLKRDDGTIVFKKENMIVENGRNYLKNLVMDKINGNTALAGTAKLNGIKFGTDNSMTTPTTTDLVANVAAYDLTVADTEFTITLLTGSEIGLEIKVTGLVGIDANAHMISELGVFFDLGDMFSRVVFEPFPLHDAVTYNLTYYIYF